MVQNSKEGTSFHYDATYNCNYYSWNERNNACPAGWAVPTEDQWTAIQTYLNSTATVTEMAMWNSGSALAGFYVILMAGVGKVGYWRSGTGTSSDHYQYFSTNSGKSLKGPIVDSIPVGMPVRCIKSN